MFNNMKNSSSLKLQKLCAFRGNTNCISMRQITRFEVTSMDRFPQAWPLCFHSLGDQMLMPADENESRGRSSTTEKHTLLSQDPEAVLRKGFNEASLILEPHFSPI